MVNKYIYLNTFLVQDATIFKMESNPLNEINEKEQLENIYLKDIPHSTYP